MALALALVEVSTMFVVICGLLMVSTQPVFNSWLDVGRVFGQSIAVSLCCGLCFYYNNLYDLRIVRSLSDFIPRLAQSLLIALILLATFYMTFPRKPATGGEFVLSMLLVAAVLLFVRTIYYSVVSRRLFTEPVLILGAGSLAQRILNVIEGAPELHYSLLGLVDDNSSDENGTPPSASRQICGNLNEVSDIIRRLKPARIIVAVAERRGRLPVHELLSWKIGGIVVEDGIEVLERATGKLAIESLVPSELAFSKAFDKPKLQLAVRRSLNVALAGVGLLLTAPLMVIIALIIKLESNGPVFFIQNRAGFRGRIFRLIKFRTMQFSEDDKENSVWQRDNTSRVTRFGKWLRKWHVDESPQFINVLCGDMDLVGPRPEMADNVKPMEEQIPYYSLRHISRPGVTGWAQVRHCYSVSLEDVTEKVRYDLYYIKNMSFWLDVRILVDTMKLVFLGAKLQSPKKDMAGPGRTRQALHRYHGTSLSPDVRCRLTSADGTASAPALDSETQT